MILDEHSTLVDVAFAVSTALAHAGERVVLCGGSAATFYAPEAYQSRDLDFVITFGARRRAIRAALEPLGFTQRPGGMYGHPTIPYTIDFLPGPVAIDEETITKFHRERRGEQELQVLTLTDVVRDRVLHFWAWGDQRALQVAVEVARRQPTEFDRANIEEWTEALAGRPGYERSRRDVILAALTLG
ncbi:MAG TPA: hypothetical protein VE591_09405 [Candidatus Acidoferrum sp.]|nr:hypothetical protein [Candidatus Acidoferrum sp.]